jgi:hypothetical protein
MDLERLEAILREVSDNLEGEGGAWQFELDGVQFACLTDTTYDRIRVIAPIVDGDQMTREHLEAVLEANFHTALDARYATSDGVLYAAFLHPLASLSEEELRSAVGQVLNLVETYGTSYSGGTLAFGVPRDPSSGSNLN